MIFWFLFLTHFWHSLRVTTIIIFSSIFSFLFLMLACVHLKEKKISCFVEKIENISSLTRVKSTTSRWCTPWHWVDCECGWLEMFSLHQMKYFFFSLRNIISKRTCASWKEKWKHETKNYNYWLLRNVKSESKVRIKLSFLFIK